MSGTDVLTWTRLTATGVTGTIAQARGLPIPTDARTLSQVALVRWISLVQAREAYRDVETDGSTDVVGDSGVRKRMGLAVRGGRDASEHPTILIRGPTTSIRDRRKRMLMEPPVLQK